MIRFVIQGWKKTKLKKQYMENKTNKQKNHNNNSLSAQAKLSPFFLLVRNHIAHSGDKVWEGQKGSFS